MSSPSCMFMNVLCCKCGIPMQPNGANICVECLGPEVDITQGLPKRLELVHCPECESYLRPPSTWVKLHSDSKDMLKFCMEELQEIMNTNRVRLVDAASICSELYSKRVTLKVRVQKEVLDGAILEQFFDVQFVKLEHMCESCSRVVQQANPDHWLVAVQLRQHHVSHRHTFFYLEQLIVEHRVAATAVRIKLMDQGIDFFFSKTSHAAKFVDFIGMVAPVRFRLDKKLVCRDPESKTYSYKKTFSVEISPICREDLIFLPPNPKGGTASSGTLGPVVICTKVTNNILLLDPYTLRHCFLDADQYWKASFEPLLTSTQLVEYIVLRVDVGDVPSEATVGGTKYVLADAQVARVKDYYGNKNDTTFSIKTHLGHLLKPGDYALGYDLLYGADSNATDCAAVDLPAAAILIKKSYQVKRQKRHRSWKLKSLDMEVDDKKGRVEQDKMDSEYEQFLNDLEENPDLRFGISLYRNHDYQPSEMMALETDRDELPSVPWEELRADLDPSEERRKMRRIT